MTDAYKGTWVITELSQLATTYLRRLVCLTLRPFNGAYFKFLGRAYGYWDI